MFEPIVPAEKIDEKPKYDYRVIRPNGRVSPQRTDVSKTWARAREQLEKQAGQRASSIKL